MTGRAEPTRDSLNALTERFTQGDRRALARLITLLDDGLPAEQLFERLGSTGSAARSAEPGGRGDEGDGVGALKVGLTGSMGVGKSTLAGALIQHLRQGDQSVADKAAEAPGVALVACDPGSRLTGGALLGDRLRVETDDDDDRLFIRSLSTRGAEGGISRSAASIVRLLERFGFGVVLLETIGVGQDQAAVRQVVDVLVMVTAPGAGDAVQWQKAGLIEHADVIAVNKADLPGADAVVADLREELIIAPTGGAGTGGYESDEAGDRSGDVVKTSVRTGEGIEELWNAIQRAARRR